MRQWTVDAFAAEPFKGNPACVVEPFDVVSCLRCFREPDVHRLWLGFGDQP